MTTTNEELSRNRTMAEVNGVGAIHFDKAQTFRLRVMRDFLTAGFEIPDECYEMSLYCWT